MKKYFFLILIFTFNISHLLKAQVNDTVRFPVIEIEAEKKDSVSYPVKEKTESNSYFNVFPNAKNGTFQIVYGSETKSPPVGWGGKLIISVINSAGKTVRSETVLDFEGELNETIDLSNEEKGSYIIEIVTGSPGNIKKEVFVRSISPEEPEENSLLNVFPNPSDGTFQIVYGSTTSNPPYGWGGQLAITIIDPYGTNVYSEIIENFDGEYNKTIDLSSGAKGVYIIEVASGKQGKVKREVVK
jgi:hypothetical protein